MGQLQRGVASIIVVLHHFCLAFLPTVKMAYPEGIAGTPLYFIVNGSSAVRFFFVLSGFVLVYRFFQNPSAVYLAAATVKRLPRLMLPAAITIFAGYAILSTWSDVYKRAAAISGSDWLATFANAKFADGFHPSLKDALAQTLKVFFYPDSFYYNSNLWTMRPEYLGSLAVFAAALTAFIPNRINGFFALLAIAVASKFVLPLVFPFLVGAVLAKTMIIWPRLSAPRNSWPVIVLLIAVIGMSVERPLVNTATSALLIAAFIAMPSMASPLSGKTGRILGKISFPLYLVHALVITSFSSQAYISSGVIAAAVTTVVASAILLTPLLLLEEWWVPFLNKVAKRAIYRVPKSGA